MRQENRFYNRGSGFNTELLWNWNISVFCVGQKFKYQAAGQTGQTNNNVRYFSAPSHCPLFQQSLRQRAGDTCPDNPQAPNDFCFARRSAP